MDKLSENLEQINNENSCFMILNEEQHKLLKEKLKYILNYIHNICTQNNIKYYAVGGTLLGAVRHKGMIPWDDDADIAMYKDDFKKFKKALKKDSNKEFFLQTLYTDKYYCQIMPKLRLNNTIIENLGEENCKMNKGIFVDIFMLDCSNHINKKKNEKKSLFHKKIMRIIGIKRLKKINEVNYSLLKRILIKIIPIWFLLLIDKIYLHAKNNGKYTMNFTSIYRIDKQTFPSNYYGEPKKLEFDGQLIYVPSEYIKILESFQISN